MEWRPGTRLVTDEQILSIFDSASSRTTKQLAEDLGITESHMRRRLKRLLARGRLGYSVVDNDSGRGRKSWVWSLKP